MNTQYEYKLPRGLGLRADSSIEDTDTASDVAVPITRMASGRRAGDSSKGPSELEYMQGGHDIRMRSSCGVSQCISNTLRHCQCARVQQFVAVLCDPNISIKVPIQPLDLALHSMYCNAGVISSPTCLR